MMFENDLQIAMFKSRLEGAIEHFSLQQCFVTCFDYALLQDLLFVYAFQCANSESNEFWKCLSRPFVLRDLNLHDLNDHFNRSVIRSAVQLTISRLIWKLIEHWYLTKLDHLIPIQSVRTNSESKSRRYREQIDEFSFRIIFKSLHSSNHGFPLRGDFRVLRVLILLRRRRRNPQTESLEYVQRPSRGRICRLASKTSVYIHIKRELLATRFQNLRDLGRWFWGNYRCVFQNL